MFWFSGECIKKERSLWMAMKMTENLFLDQENYFPFTIFIVIFYIHFVRRKSKVYSLFVSHSQYIINFRVIFGEKVMKRISFLRCISGILLARISIRLFLNRLQTTDQIQRLLALLHSQWHSCLYFFVAQSEKLKIRFGLNKNNFKWNDSNDNIAMTQTVKDIARTPVSVFVRHTRYSVLFVSELSLWRIIAN